MRPRTRARTTIASQRTLICEAGVLRGSMTASAACMATHKLQPFTSRPPHAHNPLKIQRALDDKKSAGRGHPSTNERCSGRTVLRQSRLNQWTLLWASISVELCESSERLDVANMQAPVDDAVQAASLKFAKGLVGVNEGQAQTIC